MALAGRACGWDAAGLRRRRARDGVRVGCCQGGHGVLVERINFFESLLKKILKIYFKAYLYNQKSLCIGMCATNKFDLGLLLYLI